MWRRKVKIYVFVTLIALLAGVLLFSQYLARALEDKSRIISRLYGRFIQLPEEEQLVNIFFEEIVQKIDFPVIVTDERGEIIAYNNIRDDPTRVLDKLRRRTTPIVLSYHGKTLAYVYYGASRLERLLRVAPYIQMVATLALIAIGIYWFHLVEEREKEHLWLGMAKETAHQLGTPLSSLAAWVEFVNDAHIREKMGEDIERLHKIANRFQKIGSPIKFEPIDLRNVIDHTVGYLKPRLSDRITLNVDVPYVKLEGDSELLSWMFENLLRNAVDAGATIVDIVARTKDDKVVIEVSDNGKGIKPEHRGLIFVPGFTTKHYGWGLGLSFVKRIVELHGGNIKLMRDKRTVFQILLPVR